MHTQQAKSHSPNTAPTNTAETPQKVAMSAASASRVPAWASAWDDQLPSSLLPNAGLTIQRQVAVPETFMSKNEDDVRKPESEQQEQLTDHADDTADATVQRKSDGETSSSTQVASPFIQQIQRSHTQPLEPTVRTHMESRFTTDFGGVRVHTDAKAAEAAHTMNAEAFTTGQHVFFGADRYQPTTPQGQHLLAHELTHTIQQRAGEISQARQSMQPRYTLSHPDEPLEREAEHVANTVTNGQAFAPSAISSLKPDIDNTVARQAIGLLSPPEVETTGDRQQADPIAQDIIRRLQSDPEDRSGEVKRLLATLNPSTLRIVLDQVQTVIPPATLKLLTAARPEQNAAESEEPLPPSSSSATVRTPEASGAVTEAQSAASSQQTFIGEPLGPEQHMPPETVPVLEGQASPEEITSVPGIQLAPGVPSSEGVGSEIMPPTDVEAKASPAGEPALVAQMMPKIELETGAAPPEPGAAALPAPGTIPAGLSPAGGVSVATALPVHMPTTSDMQPVVEGSVPIAEAYPTTSADVTPAGAKPETATSEPTTVPAEDAPAGTAPSTEAAEVAGPETTETSTGTEAPAESAAEVPAGGAAAETAGPGGETPSDAVSAETGEVATEAEAPAGGAGAETAATEPGETSAETETPAAETPSAGAESASGSTGAGAPTEAELTATGSVEPAASESTTGAGEAPGSSVSESGAETAPAEQPAESTTPASSEAAETGTPTGVASESTPVEAGATSAETAPASTSESTPAEVGTTSSEVTPASETPAMSASRAPVHSTMAGGEGAGMAQDTTPADEMSGAAEAAETEAAPAASGTLGSGERESLLTSVAQAPVDQSGAAGAAGSEGGAASDGSGQAIPDPPPPTIPDVSQAQPAQALAQVSNLPPAQLQVALGGVSAATTQSIAAQRAELAASPPQMERPSGSSMIGTGGEQEKQQAQAEAASGKATKHKATVAPKKTGGGKDRPTPPTASTRPAPPPPVAAVRIPPVTGDAEGKVTAADAAQLKTALHSMPTTDPGLQVVAEPASKLVLDGEANPANVQAQHLHLERDMNQAQLQGKQDVAQPMGEQHIYPDVPKETLRAQVSAGGTATAGTAAGAAPAATASVSDEDTAASIIAQEQKGADIQAAATQAQSGMVAQQQEHVTKVAQERADSQRKVDEMVAQNAQDQQKQRADAQAEVQQQREQCGDAQDKLVEENRGEAEKKVQDGTEAVSQEQAKGEQEAAGHIEEGNRKAENERANAEQQARTERKKAEKKTEEDGGIFGWLSSKVKGFFDEIKQGIQKVFDEARKAVKGFIDAAKQLAAKAIDAARQFVVNKIREVGNVLIAIGDKVLAGFPGLRDRFRSAVKKTVSVATAVVNKLADELKKDVQKALDILGKGLDAALGLLEKGLLAYVDTLNQVVQGAIKFAKGIAETFGAFITIIKDIAAGPLKWLGNLGASAKDGIRNHLWQAFKEAIKEWFNQKLEEVLGLGLAIWNILKNGGISLKEIGMMAWEAIKEAIPGVLVQILIEKLVAMIVPAAGAIMTIIEGLQAAWGTIQRIIAAIKAFVDFLKAVKNGNAGEKFAKMLAAAAIAVIDFVANWLLKRLRKPSGGVASRVRAIAQRIGKGLKKVGQVIVKGVKKVVQVVKKAAKAVWQGIKKGAKKVFGALKKAGKWVLKKMGKVGQKIELGLKKVGEKIKGGIQKVKDWWKKRGGTKEERQKKARKRTKSIIDSMLALGVPMSVLALTVRGLRKLYGWSLLEIRRNESNQTFSVYGGFSPDDKITEGQEHIEVKHIEFKDHGIYDIGKATTPGRGWGGPKTESGAGKQWELATNPYVLGKLTQELSGGHTPTVEAQKTLKWDVLVRRPDFVAKVLQTEGVQGVHIVEQTIVADFYADKFGDVFARHKMVQIAGTLRILKEQYSADPNVKITYHIIVPKDLPDSTKGFLKGELEKLETPNLAGASKPWTRDAIVNQVQRILEATLPKL